MKKHNKLEERVKERIREAGRKRIAQKILRIMTTLPCSKSYDPPEIHGDRGRYYENERHFVRKDLSIDASLSSDKDFLCEARIFYSDLYEVFKFDYNKIELYRPGKWEQELNAIYQEAQEVRRKEIAERKAKEDEEKRYKKNQLRHDFGLD